MISFSRCFGSLHVESKLKSGVMTLMTGASES